MAGNTAQLREILSVWKGKAIKVIILDKEFQEKNICRCERFGTLLRNERNRLGVSIPRLCAGLMDETLLCRIENGDREPDASTMTRLMDRLGIVFQDEGSYVFYDDYEEWQSRWAIITSIEGGRLGEAEKLLYKYASSYSGNPVRQQFGKVMDIQRIMKKAHSEKNQDNSYTGINANEIGELYSEALKITVPQIAVKSLDDLWMSVDELNIVLESRFYGFYGHENSGVNVQLKLTHYFRIIRYICLIMRN